MQLNDETNNIKNLSIEDVFSESIVMAYFSLEKEVSKLFFAAGWTSNVK